MAGKARTKSQSDGFITYVVVKPHDGLKKGAILRRKAGHPGAEYCVKKGLWQVRKSNKSEE